MQKFIHEMDPRGQLFRNLFRNYIGLGPSTNFFKEVPDAGMGRVPGFWWGKGFRLGHIDLIKNLLIRPSRKQTIQHSDPEACLF